MARQAAKFVLAAVTASVSGCGDLGGGSGFRSLPLEARFGIESLALLGPGPALTLNIILLLPTASVADGILEEGPGR
jgi:hypothetical protein